MSFPWCLKLPSLLVSKPQLGFGSLFHADFESCFLLLTGMGFPNWNGLGSSGFPGSHNLSKALPSLSFPCFSLRAHVSVTILPDDQLPSHLQYSDKLAWESSIFHAVTKPLLTLITMLEFPVGVSISLCVYWCLWQSFLDVFGQILRTSYLRDKQPSLRSISENGIYLLNEWMDGWMNKLCT